MLILDLPVTYDGVQELLCVIASDFLCYFLHLSLNIKVSSSKTIKELWTAKNVKYNVIYKYC